MSPQSNPVLLLSLKSFSRASSLFAILIGGLVLVGWLFDIIILKSVLPGLATMKANAAFAFVIAGVSLWLSQTERTVQQRRGGRVCALMVTLIGLLTLAEYLGDFDLGIDELLFDDPLTAQTSHPGRMASATALSFLMLGAALLLLDRETPDGNRPSEWLALAAMLISVLATIGYVYDVQSLYRMAPYMSVAFHTALTLLVLSVGIWCARPDRGLMALTSSDTGGGLVVRRLIPSGIAVLIGLGWLRLSAQRVGYYDTEFGLSLMVLSAMATLTVLIWLNARSLNQAEEKIIRANRLYAVLSQINQSIVRVRERDRLFAEICRIAVRYGLFRIAWIGLIDGLGQPIKAMAHSGAKEDALPQGLVSLFEDSEAQSAIREDRHFICNDVRHDPRMTLWRQRAEDHGFRSLSALPIHMEERVVGVFCIYADKPNFFNQEEIQLLEEVMLDISYALENMDREAQRQRAEDALRDHAERLRSLSRQLLHTQEAERRSIARELHDQVGQLLTGLKLNLEMLQHGNIDSAGVTLAGALDLINELTTRVRSLSLDLRPPMLDDLGLLPALLWHFDNYTKQTHVRVSFDHDGLDRRMAPDIETAAYRIVQEALTNVARHAGVDEVEVRCFASQTRLHIEVEDHGKGFDPETALRSYATSGLSGMHERAALLGGHLTVDSTPGEGTRVIAEIPVNSVLNHEQ